MICVKCREDLPKIEGMKRCPFCGALTGGIYSECVSEQNEVLQSYKGDGFIDSYYLHLAASRMTRQAAGIDIDKKGIQVKNMEEKYIRFWNSLLIRLYQAAIDYLEETKC